MFSLSRSHLRSHGSRKQKPEPQQFRPTLEVLEDRVTPSGIGMMPVSSPPVNNAPAAVAPPTPGPTGNAIGISPTQLFFLQGQTEAAISILLLNTTTGQPVSGGTVTLTVINPQGGTVGTPVTTNVGESGQVNATYTLPPNLRVGPYTLQAVYHNSGSPLDGGQGTALLYIAIGPINSPPSSSSQGQAQVQTSAQTQTLSLFATLQADFALFVDGFELAVDRILHQSTDAVEAGIDATMASGGPWGSFFEMAGEMVVNQAVQSHNV